MSLSFHNNSFAPKGAMTSLSPSQFLAAIWPAKLLTNETLELRLIDRQKNEVHREFFRSSKELLERASKVEGRDIYFGVSTRFGESGKKRDCYRVKAVWADLDDCKIDDCDFGDHMPNYLVNSGTGVHAYWVFSTPYVVRGNTDRQVEIEAINRALANEFNGDMAAIDVSRILRVPGFLNMKHTPLKPVRAYAL